MSVQRLEYYEKYLIYSIHYMILLLAGYITSA